MTGALSAKNTLSELRVAIAHDWLLGMRGGERVLESLLRIFPRADIYTLFYDPRGVSPEINRRRIYPSFLSSLPGIRRYYRTLLPFMPGAIERLDLRREYDLVISTSHCVAHGIRVPAGIPHITYCFSPMRYLHDQNEAYARGGAGFSARMLRLIAPRLRRWDAAAARRCGNYIAISRHVAARIKRVYDLDAKVVFPPVRTDFFTPAPQPPDPNSAPYLIVSALVPYKRIDIAIEAANRLKKNLVIAGSGPLESKLRALAGPTVRFLGWVDDVRLRELYRSCAALIFPGEEDFGIVPLEAMACGRPVLALRAGGLIETHEEGKTGAFFESCEIETLSQIWEKFDPFTYNPIPIRAHAGTFAESRFHEEMAFAISTCIKH
ncbi:glycosyltransferase [Candidatus Sumerlaeota bacterium]|nr:glycosyltransferase [Candidatus Sumerlaeota bacterium]